MQFDNGPTGPAGLEGFIRAVNGSFPVLSCNLDASHEPALAGLVQRFALLPLQHSNVTVGVVGLTSIETTETSNPGPTISFLPYEETLPGCVADARAAGADIVVLLSHIGFQDDRALAASPAAAGVDLIVGASARLPAQGRWWLLSVVGKELGRGSGAGVQRACRTACRYAWCLAAHPCFLAHDGM